MKCLEILHRNCSLMVSIHAWHVQAILGSKDISQLSSVDEERLHGSLVFNLTGT